VYGFILNREPTVKELSLFADRHPGVVLFGHEPPRAYGLAGCEDGTESAGRPLVIYNPVRFAPEEVSRDFELLICQPGLWPVDLFVDPGPGSFPFYLAHIHENPWAATIVAYSVYAKTRLRDRTVTGRNRLKVMSLLEDEVFEATGSDSYRVLFATVAPTPATMPL
jgi:hypothetical protein